MVQGGERAKWGGHGSQQRCGGAPAWAAKRGWLHAAPAAIQFYIPPCPSPPHDPARRYEQYITYGGAVLQVFQMYRLVVLPVANTWMSWSLLSKLGIAPSTAVVACTGLAVLVLIVAGVQVRMRVQPPAERGPVPRGGAASGQHSGGTGLPAPKPHPPHCAPAPPPALPRPQMRFLLHAPLQLASVLFAASSTSEVCGRFFASNTGLGCMGAVSLMQLSLGVFIPGIMCHLLDMRSTGEQRHPRARARETMLYSRNCGRPLCRARVLCGLGPTVPPNRFPRLSPACPPADKPYLPHVQAKRWLLQS